MKKKLKKAILILIIIATTIACIYVMSKNDIIKIKDKWFSKGNILNLNEYSAQATNITTYDVTGLVTGAETSHDCNKYSTSKYDDNYHWTECTICGKILKAKEAHNKDKSAYSWGVANCYPTNTYTIYCKDNCGYSIQGHDEHKNLSNWKITLYGYSQFRHYKSCNDCKNMVATQDCYKMVNGKAEQITCTNLGTCVECGHVYTSNDVTHWILSNEGKCRFYDTCKKSINFSYDTKYSQDYSIAYVTVTVTGENIAIDTSRTNAWNDGGIKKEDITKESSISGNKLTVKYTIKQNGSLDKEYKFRPIIYCSTTSSSKVTTRYYIYPSDGVTLKRDNVAPTISEKEENLSITNNGWVTSKKIILTGTENISSVVKINMKDDEGNIYLNNALASVTNKQWKYEFVPNIEADANGKTFTITVEDNAKNISEKTITIYKTDKKAPVPQRMTGTPNTWSKTKSMTFSATDLGVGNVEIAFNNESRYENATLDGNNYTKSYIFTGNVPESVKAAIYYKDGLGNSKTEFINIYKLDNTAPTITSADLEQNTVTIEANDKFYQFSGTPNGSGVVSYLYMLSNERLDSPELNTANASTEVSNEFEINSLDKNKYIYVSAVDAVGNISDAVEIPIPHCTVVYDPNDNSTTSAIEDEAGYNTAYTIKSNMFTRRGYRFVGWNETKDGSGKDWTESIGKSFTWTTENRITLYAQWEIDESQTKELNYIIQYYKENELQVNDTKTIRSTVQAAQPDTMTIDKGNIDTNKYDGYVFNNIVINNKEYNSLYKIPSNVVTGTIIRVNYRKRNDLRYTVNYLEKGTNKVLHKSKTQGNMTLGDVITSENEKIEIDGYVYESVTPEKLTIGTEENIINIYYTKRIDLKFKVNYLEKGSAKELHKSKIQENMTYNDTIISKDQVIPIEGYKYDSADKVSIKITAGENIINLYYTKRNDLSYTVNYLEKDTNKVLHAQKTQGKMTFESVVTSKNEIIDIDGYNYNSVNPESLTITTGTNVINIYYTKRNDLSYTVNYLEKDTDKVLHDAKVVENKTFEEVVTSSDEVIDIDGYNYDSVNPESLTITTGTNVINIYYTKKNDLSYTVNYLEKDTDKVLHDAKVVENKTFEDVVTSRDEVIDIDGYNYNSVSPESLTITTGTNVINIYYTKRNDLSYTVNYLEKDTDKILHEAKVVENKTFEEVVTSRDEVIDIDGYNYDSVNPESLTITTGTNVINIYYTKRNDLSYTVNYLEKDTNKVLHDTKVVENKTFEEVVTSSNEVINIYGYNYDSVNPESLTITTGTNVINIYYTKRNDLSYTVNYLEKDTDKILHKAKLVENKTFEEVVTSSDEVIDIDGYNYNSVNPESLTITTGTNVINIYYTRRNDLSYTVNYLEKDTDKILHEAKLVENKTFEEVVTSSDEIIAIDGYNYDSVNPESLTITTGTNVINIYYTKRNDLSYTVNYLEKDTDKVLHDAKVVENKTFEEVVTSSDEVIDIDGYNYDSVNPESLTITTGTNVINIYYTKKNDLSYTVNYLEKDTDKVLHDAKVVENKTFEEVVTSSDEVIDIDGYNYDSVNPESLKITTGTNVINIYYTKKNDLSYTVNYLEKDTDKILHEAKVVENKTFEDVVTSRDEVIDIDGYNYDSINPESLTITTGTNVINIYYTKRNDLSYTVNYLEKDTDKVLHEAKVVENKTFEEVVTSSNEVINIYGYNYDSIDPEELIIKTNNNIINIYYVKKDTAVIVKHYEEGTTNKLSETVTIQGKVFDEYKTEQATDIPEKYEFSYVEGNTTGTMTEEKIEVIYYYKVKDSKLTVRYVDKNHDTEIIQADETIGKVDDKYETQAREIEGYTLVGNSENTEGTLKVEPTEVIYYYKKNTAVQVKYIDIDTNEELSQETIEGLEGDEYQTESKNFERYVLVKETDNTEGTMTKDEIIVIYYYEHQSKGVIEKHIDITTNEILENKVYTGKYGTPYTTKAKTIEGYDVVKERLPENAEGTMIEDVIEVNYYYIAKAKINVEYIDRATGKSLITSDADQITIIGHEGDTYQTEEKTFEGYDLIEIVGNAEGTMTKGETTIKYIYARPTKVIVRYIDQITGENLITSNAGDDPITIIGHEGDAYQTEEKTITGYDLVKTSENTEGTMTKEDIEVTYYYIAKTKVIVNYIDKITGKNLLTSSVGVDVPGDPITITGHEGDTYQTEEKTFAGYDLVKTSENTEGRMTKETIEVTYYYARPAKVKVNYLDIDTGKEIANSIEINGHEGDEYKTEAKEIKYYELKEEAKNKEGRMTVEVEGEIVNNLTEVNYYYKKLEFNFKLEKRIESIKVNGESREVKGEVGKVEIYKKELEKAKVEVVYKIRVINAGKIKGKADVMDIIPSGMTVKEESKGRWKIEGMTATTSTGEIEAGKYEDIEIIMTWNNAENNLGDIENIAQITKTDNDAGFDDIDEKDDADGANVIITVSTGDTTYVIIMSTVLVFLSGIALTIITKSKNIKK